MTGPVYRFVHMAEHDCRGRSDSEAVRRFHDLKPLPGIDLVGAEDGANLVVENFRRCSRQGSETGVFEAGKKLQRRQVKCCRALPHFKRRKRVNVHIRHGRLDRAANVQVVLARVSGMNTSLHADFRGAPFPGFTNASLNLFHLQVVGRAAQVFAQPTLGKRTESTAEVANIGVVDVAIDRVGYLVSDQFTPQPIGGRADSGEIPPPGAEQSDNFRFTWRVSAQSTVENAPQQTVVWTTLGGVDEGSHWRRWVLRGAGGPGFCPGEAVGIDGPYYWRMEV